MLIVLSHTLQQRVVVRARVGRSAEIIQRQAMVGVAAETKERRRLGQCLFPKRNLKGSYTERTWLHAVPSKL